MSLLFTTALTHTLEVFAFVNHFYVFCLGFEIAQDVFCSAHDDMLLVRCVCMETNNKTQRIFKKKYYVSASVMQGVSKLRGGCVELHYVIMMY